MKKSPTTFAICMRTSLARVLAPKRLGRNCGHEGSVRRRALEVILETGELQTYDNVRIASELAMRARADFIKTSTGKVTPAATLRAS
jgi:hypothetical protein